MADRGKNSYDCIDQQFSPCSPCVHSWACHALLAIGPRRPRQVTGVGSGCIVESPQDGSHRGPQGQTTDRERSGGPSGEILDIHDTAQESRIPIPSCFSHAYNNSTLSNPHHRGPRHSESDPHGARQVTELADGQGVSRTLPEAASPNIPVQRRNGVTSCEQIRSGLREQPARSVYSPWSRDTVPLRSRPTSGLVIPRSQAQRHSVPL